MLTCPESELLAAGLLGGVRRREPAGELSREDVLAMVHRIGRSERDGGPLADVFAFER